MKSDLIGNDWNSMMLEFNWRVFFLWSFERDSTYFMANTLLQSREGVEFVMNAINVRFMSILHCLPISDPRCS